MDKCGIYIEILSLGVDDHFELWEILDIFRRSNFPDSDNQTALLEFATEILMEMKANQLITFSKRTLENQYGPINGDLLIDELCNLENWKPSMGNKLVFLASPVGVEYYYSFGKDYYK